MATKETIEVLTQQLCTLFEVDINRVLELTIAIRPINHTRLYTCCGYTASKVKSLACGNASLNGWIGLTESVFFGVSSWQLKARWLS